MIKDCPRSSWGQESFSANTWKYGQSNGAGPPSIPLISKHRYPRSHRWSDQKRIRGSNICGGQSATYAHMPLQPAMAVKQGTQ